MQDFSGYGYDRLKFFCLVKKKKNLYLTSKNFCFIIKREKNIDCLPEKIRKYMLLKNSESSIFELNNFFQKIANMFLGK